MRLAACGIGALYLIHAAVFGSYIADDAGISLAYARNLAAGYGPVLYPGAAAVEGYSNPLWTALLALGAALGLDGRDGVPLLKILSVLIGGGVLAISAVTARQAYPQDTRIQWLAPVILAVWTPFVFWSAAGLENALYALLVLAAAWLQLRELHDPARWPLSALALAGVALTRPEGCAFFVAFLIHRLAAGAGPRRIVAWTVIFCMIFGAFLAARYAVFGDWLPNTYYAKASGRSFAELWQYLTTPEDRGLSYVRGFAAANGVLLAVALAGLLDLAAWRTQWLFASVIGGTALFALFAGGDFWPSWRFFSPALPFVALAAQHAVNRLTRTPRLAAAAAAALAGIVAFQSLGPSLELRRRHQADTLISLQGRLKQARRIQRIALEMGVRDPLYLEADIGGPAVAGMRVLDLGGLTDIHIARFHYHPPFFREYVFKEQRPHFIRTHATWTRSSRVSAYPEFHEQYVAIRSYSDSRGLHGEFVRKDLLSGAAAAEPPREPPSFRQAIRDARRHRAREDARARQGWTDTASR